MLSITSHQRKKEKLKYIYTVEYYLVIRKGILPFATTWMDLESIMLTEISKLGKDTYHMISLICEI